MTDQLFVTNMSCSVCILTGLHVCLISTNCEIELIMAIEFEDVSDTFRRIKLSGRLDIPGTEAISIKFTNLAAAAARRVVVDLTEVSFLASIGIRELISSAKALQQRGGRMILFVGDNAGVSKTLEVTGVDTLIPMFSSLPEADQAALA